MTIIKIKFSGAIQQTERQDAGSLLHLLNIHLRQPLYPPDDCYTRVSFDNIQYPCQIFTLYKVVRYLTYVLNIAIPKRSRY